jgi:hypothetical protein
MSEPEVRPDPVVPPKHDLEVAKVVRAAIGERPNVMKLEPMAIWPPWRFSLEHQGQILVSPRPRLLCNRLPVGGLDYFVELPPQRGAIGAIVDPEALAEEAHEVAVGVRDLEVVDRRGAVLQAQSGDGQAGAGSATRASEAPGPKAPLGNPWLDWSS